MISLKIVAHDTLFQRGLVIGRLVHGRCLYILDIGSLGCIIRIEFGELGGAHWSGIGVEFTTHLSDLLLI